MERSTCFPVYVLLQSLHVSWQTPIFFNLSEVMVSLLILLRVRSFSIVLSVLKAMPDLIFSNNFVINFVCWPTYVNVANLVFDFVCVLKVSF